MTILDVAVLYTGCLVLNMLRCLRSIMISNVHYVCKFNYCTCKIIRILKDLIRCMFTQSLKMPSGVLDSNKTTYILLFGFDRCPNIQINILHVLGASLLDLIRSLYGVIIH